MVRAFRTLHVSCNHLCQLRLVGVGWAWCWRNSARREFTGPYIETSMITVSWEIGRSILTPPVIHGRLGCSPLNHPVKIGVPRYPPIFRKLQWMCFCYMGGFFGFPTTRHSKWLQARTLSRRIIKVSMEPEWPEFTDPRCFLAKKIAYLMYWSWFCFDG